MLDQELGLTRYEEGSVLKHESRILILGSRISGAFVLGKGLLDYLRERGIDSVSVDVSKDAGLIDQNFWNNALGGNGSNITPPIGVILLPEMRQYAPGGYGMTLDSYRCGFADYVRTLCEENGVPLVEVQRHSSDLEIEERLKKALLLK